MVDDVVAAEIVQVDADSACEARERARDSILIGAREAQLIGEAGHLQRGDGSVPPLVAVRATGTILRDATPRPANGIDDF